jgi:3-oxoacyl-[acyl-carrier-protein] synthase-1
VKRARCYVGAVGLANALGNGKDAVREGLFAGDTSGMRLEDGLLPDAKARVGRCRAELPPMPAGNERFDCRSNRLLLHALAEIRDEVAAAVSRAGAHRVGVVIGTSTAGILEGERAFAAFVRDGAFPPGFRYSQQEIGLGAHFLARHVGAGGPAYTVSTACTSSAKAIAAGRRLIASGLCDVVVAGGTDVLCELTVSGFTALESTTPEICNPLSRNRKGINIGEGAALMLLGREPAEVEILGCGESSDAHHISAPDPEGRGAEIAMRAALADAGLAPEDIGYVNLHATATQKNDLMEAHAVSRVFPGGVPVSGTKPLTGHTLGAAGATEAAFCWLALREGRLPPHVWDGEADPALPPLVLARRGDRLGGASKRACMSNSFAFGGNNAVLVLGDAR